MPKRLFARTIIAVFSLQTTVEASLWKKKREKDYYVNSNKGEKGKPVMFSSRTSLYFSEL